MKRHAKLLKQLLLFGMVGGVSLFIDVGVTTLLFKQFHVPAYLAGIIGFLTAFCFNFPVNRKHVFNHSKQDRFTMRQQIIMYFCLSAFNLMMTGFLMEVLVEGHVLSITYAKIFVTALIAVWNFLLFKYLIFSKRPDQVELEGLIIQ